MFGEGIRAMQACQHFRTKCKDRRRKNNIAPFATRAGHDIGHDAIAGIIAFKERVGGRHDFGGLGHQGPVTTRPHPLIPIITTGKKQAVAGIPVQGGSIEGCQIRPV